MADYSSFDPRKTIRTAIGTAWYIPGEGDVSVVTVSDNYNDIVRIQIRMDEEFKTESLDNLPVLIMKMANVTYTPANIAATVREIEAYIDIDLVFTDTDNIDSTSFGKKVMDKLQDLIRDYQCTFASNNKMFVNIESVRCISEPNAHQVVFHYVCTIYCIYYDLCDGS